MSPGGSSYTPGKPPLIDLLPGVGVKETDAANTYSNKYYNCDILIHHSICGHPFVLCDMLRISHLHETKLQVPSENIRVTKNISFNQPENYFYGIFYVSKLSYLM